MNLKLEPDSITRVTLPVTLACGIKNQGTSHKILDHRRPMRRGFVGARVGVRMAALWGKS